MCHLPWFVVCLASRDASNAMSSLVQSARYLMSPISALYLVLFDGSSAGLLLSSTNFRILGRGVLLVDPRDMHAASMLLDI